MEVDAKGETTPMIPSKKSAASMPGMSEVLIDEAEGAAHYCFVLPLATSSNGETWAQDLSKMRPFFQRWAKNHPIKDESPDRIKSLDALKQVVHMERFQDEDARNVARELFRDWENDPGPSWFNDITAQTTFEELSIMFRDHFVDFLQIEHNFTVTAKKSVDDDEMFVLVQVDSDRELQCPGVYGNQQKMVSPAEVSAAKLNMRLPLKPETYDQAHDRMIKRNPSFKYTIEVPTLPNRADKYRLPPQQLSAYVPLSLKLAGNDSPLQDFRDSDLIRIVFNAVNNTYKLDVLQAVGMLNKHFPVHRTEDVENLKRNLIWGNSFPNEDHRNSDMIRDYFGEEVGFLFEFMTYYCRELRFPAFMGVVLVFRASLGNIEISRIVQTIWAACLALWAAYFCQNFSQREKEAIIRWGAKAADQGQAGRLTLLSYNEQDEFWEEGPKLGFIRVRFFRSLTYIIGLFIFFSMIGGIAVIQFLRHGMLSDPKDFVWFFKPFTMSLLGPGASDTRIAKEVKFLGPKVGAFLITLQIRICDLLWDRFVRWVVMKENHRTQQQLNDAMAVKLFVIKFFNQIYPYFYIAFLKEQLDGCDAKGGCTVELQNSLAIFFISSGAVDLLLLFCSWLDTRWQILKEVRESKRRGKTEKDYTYLQFQAKVEDPWPVLDDMLYIAIQFCFICCFTIAFPFMPTWALLYNLITWKLVMYRRLVLSKRSYPTSVEGLGIWNIILKSSVYVACLMNSGIAVFTMKPIKDFDDYTQMKYLFIIEHGLFFIVSAMFYITPATLWLVERHEEFNADHVHLLLDPKREIFKEDREEVRRLSSRKRTRDVISSMVYPQQEASSA